MTFYIIILDPESEGETLEWIKDFCKLKDSKSDISIATGTTDKQEDDVILIECEKEDDLDKDFHQKLEEDDMVIDYVIYSL